MKPSIVAKLEALHERHEEVQALLGDIRKNSFTVSYTGLQLSIWNDFTKLMMQQKVLYHILK